MTRAAVRLDVRAREHLGGDRAGRRDHDERLRRWPPATSRGIGAPGGAAAARTGRRRKPRLPRDPEPDRSIWIVDRDGAVMELGPDARSPPTGSRSSTRIHRRRPRRPRSRSKGSTSAWGSASAPTRGSADSTSCPEASARSSGPARSSRGTDGATRETPSRSVGSSRSTRRATAFPTRPPTWTSWSTAPTSSAGLSGRRIWTPTATRN